MCLKNNINNTLTLAGVAIGNVGKTIRSILFNLFIYIIGFACGYTCIGITILHYASKHPNYANIQLLRKNLERLHLQNKKFYLADGQLVDEVMVNMANEVRTNSLNLVKMQQNKL